MRLAPLGQATPRLLDFSTSDSELKWQRGTILSATATDINFSSGVPNWGEAELIYVGYIGAAVVLPGTLCSMVANFRFNVTAVAATVANTGAPVYVALTNFQAGNTTTQYGWLLRSGVCPVRYAVAATTGRMFAGTAGLATPTAAAG